jgi:RNA-directed DNA polymerase
MGDSGRRTRLVPAFVEKVRGEAPKRLRESLTAKRGTASPAVSERLMEEACERETCKHALKRVKADNGSAGVDGMSVWQLPEFLK